MCCSLCRLLLKQLQALLFMNIVALIKLFYVSLSAKSKSNFTQGVQVK